MTRKVLIPIADGVEEIEAVCMIDTLRRADLEVTVASVQDSPHITASRGVRITADCLLSECTENNYDMIALPGGLPGSDHLAECVPLLSMLKQQRAARRWIAAICAAPAVVLQPNGLLEGIRATCYPTLLNQLDSAYASQEGVVVDQTYVTGQGPGLACAFALTLVEVLAGPEERHTVAQAMLIE